MQWRGHDYICNCPTVICSKECEQSKKFQNEPSLPKVDAILKEANSIVNGPRQADYGHPSENFQRIANLWNIYLDDMLAPGLTLSPRDISLMMVLLKIAREMESSKHDNILDAIGYLALAEEVS